MSEKTEQSDEIWVKLDGVLGDKLDPPSSWAIGGALPHAREVLEFAGGLGRVLIYGTQCETPRGQRSVQRWLTSNGLADLVHWVTHEPTPPAGAEVIDTWPTSTTSN